MVGRFGVSKWFIQNVGIDKVVEIGKIIQPVTNSVVQNL